MDDCLEAYGDGREGLENEGDQGSLARVSQDCKWVEIAQEAKP